MLRDAYVTGLGVCLPNDPVSNADMEKVLGRLKRQSASMKRRILMKNGITSRHYAIDPATGKVTHTNAKMTAEAILDLCRSAGFSVDDIACMACGTSSADQIIPAHASMVHAEVGCPPCEVVTISGVCCTGVSAFKYGFLNVAGGLHENAVVTGSELASPSLRASHFEPQIRLNQRNLEHQPMLPFANEFLRWMLSDGAGAMLITSSPNENALSLRIDWVEIESFAHQSDVCMYFGMRKQDDGAIESYRTIDDEAELFRGGFLSLAQDVGVLTERLPTLMKEATERTAKKHRLKGPDVDWLLPHYSSQMFRQMLYDGLVELDLEMPFEKWFTNLSSRGNTGAASIYIILQELMASGRLRRGQRILCMVPESSRMLFGFIHFTVV